MKPILWLGISLIILGGLIFAYRGITHTTHENIIQLGPIQATEEVKKAIPLLPIWGVMALAGGIVLIIVGVRKPNP